MARLRQLVIVARDFDLATQAIAEAFDTHICHRDPALAGLGLQNALLPISDSFFEVVSPIEKVTTAGKYLDKFGVGPHAQECSGYMIEMQVSDVVGVEDRWTASRKRIILRPGRDGHETPVEYAKKGHLNKPGLSGLHWHPKDIGVIMETAEHHPAAEWQYAGNTWLQEPWHAKVGVGFQAAELVSDDPQALARDWAYGLGCPLNASGTGIMLQDGGEVKFRLRRHKGEDGLVGIDIRAANKSLVGKQFDLCGVSITMVEDKSHRGKL